ncbi:sulfite exporter TauE/SafE family protein [Candidatus Eisenbacteria bacterium]|uniref:Probable membrane transporter protein n=1 Tax=Eiseniibacteriota bacterium TaxID=2212470 RepID=A0ABV6YNR8_UNCEI
MDLWERGLVAACGLVVSIFSVSVGGTALVMVPLLIFLGLDPRTAVASNRFAILFLSTSGALTFMRSVPLPQPKVIAAHIVPVVAGAFLGAILVMMTAQGTIRVVVAVATIVVALLLLLKRNVGVEPAAEPAGRGRVLLSLALVFPLSIYGGYFGGGYAAMLTYLLVFVLGLTFLQAVAATRMLSVFMAASASILLGTRGVIDFSVAIPLAAAYIIGGRIGARIAIRKGNRWVKTLFVLAAIAMSLRLLITTLW